MRRVALVLMSLAVFAGGATSAGAAKPGGDAASGSGTITIVDGLGHERDATFRFHATADTSGTVSGHATYGVSGASDGLGIDMNCLVVSGSDATLSGVVTRSVRPSDTGKTAIFSVHDGSPERLSEMLVVEAGMGDCETIAPPADHDSTKGNLKVRDV